MISGLGAASAALDMLKLPTGEVVPGAIGRFQREIFGAVRWLQ